LAPLALPQQRTWNDCRRGRDCSDGRERQAGARGARELQGDGRCCHGCHIGPTPPVVCRARWAGDGSGSCRGDAHRGAVRKKHSARARGTVALRQAASGRRRQPTDPVRRAVATDCARLMAALGALPTTLTGPGNSTSPHQTARAQMLGKNRQRLAPSTSGIALLYFVILPVFVVALVLMGCVVVACRFVDAIKPLHPFAWRVLLWSSLGFVLANSVMLGLLMLPGASGSTGLEQAGNLAKIGYASVLFLSPAIASFIGFFGGAVLGIRLAYLSANSTPLAA